MHSVMNFAEMENIIKKHNQHYEECIIEPLQLIEEILPTEMYAGFLLGNVIKYRIRAGHKGAGQEDIDKAMNYELLYKELKKSITNP